MTRFKNYIVEQEQNILNKLKTDCKPFLKEIGSKGFLYRGYKKKNIKDIEKVIPRKDRRPLGTEPEMHELLNDLFYKKFGWKVRSEGVFVSPNVHETIQYGHPYLFFPIGTYKYVWSSNVTDLTICIEDEMENAYYDSDGEDIDGVIERIVNSYITNGLKNNFQYRCEMAFKCKSYYLVNITYEKLLEKEL